MVQSLESSNIISPQEMHQRVLMQKMCSYDKDSKVGLSKTELNKYLMDSAGAAPEFAQKLAEKFGQVDQNKDGQLSSAEIGALQNDRGMWSVTPLGASSIPQFGGATPKLQSEMQGLTANNTSGSSADLLSKNIQNLVKKGLNIANNNPDLMNKLEGIVHKII